MTHERDDLAVTKKHANEILSVLQKGDSHSLENKVKELGRKVIIFEVNEAGQYYLSTNPVLSQY